MTWKCIFVYILDRAVLYPVSSIGRAPAIYAGRCGFESHIGWGKRQSLGLDPEVSVEMERHYPFVKWCFTVLSEKSGEVGLETDLNKS